MIFWKFWSKLSPISVGMESFEGLNLTAHCKNYSLEHLKQFNLALSITSMLALLLTLVMLLLVIFYRSFGTILQRLIIYLIISITAYLTASSVEIELQPEIFQGDLACKWIGFSKVSIFIITLIFSCEISVYLFCLVYHQVHQTRLPELSKSQSAMLELALLFIAIVIPPVLLIYPKNYFGLSGASCFVEKYENGNCTTQHGAKIMISTIVCIYITFGTFIIICYVFLVLIFLWLACKSKRGRKQLLIVAGRTIFLILLLILSFVVHLISIWINKYLLDDQKIHPTWGVILLSTSTPLSQVIHPIAYIFYLNSIKHFKWKSTSSTAGRWKRRGKLYFNRVIRKESSSSNRSNTFRDNNSNDQPTDVLTPPLASIS